MNNSHERSGMQCCPNVVVYESAEDEFYNSGYTIHFFVFKYIFKMDGIGVLYITLEATKIILKH